MGLGARRYVCSVWTWVARGGEDEAPLAPPGLAGFEGSGMDFSVDGLGGLSTLGDTPLIGTFFTGLAELMSQGIL
jgi:hypothetical protein